MTKELYKLYSKIYWKKQTKDGEMNSTMLFLSGETRNSKINKQEFGMFTNLWYIDG